MKLRYLPVLIFVVFTCLQSGVERVLRVKALGLASPGIQPGARARAAALRAAKVEGYKKLARAAGMDIEEEAHIKGARVVKKTYISDYKVEVVMEMPLPQPVRSGISRLKKEIKTIETRISNLNKRLEKLEKMLRELEKKAKNRGSREKKEKCKN
jgi:hypothetical protein